MLRELLDPSSSPAGRRRTPEATDVALLRCVAGGDMSAFEALYRNYHPRLCRFLGPVIRRDGLIEEALDDTMLVVWRRAATFTGECKVSTWIFAIAYRVALKSLRRVQEPVDAAPSDELPTDESGPERRHGSNETRRALLSALEQLSPEQRSVLVLTYYHDLPYAEIAGIVDCPVDTVKTRMFHGRRRLRALLTGELSDWL